MPVDNGPPSGPPSGTAAYETIWSELISIGDPSGRVKRRKAIPERCRNATPLATTLDAARVFARAGDDEAAIQTYLAVLAADPTHRDALIELGSIAAAAERLAASRTLFTQAVALHPNDPLAHVGLADRLAETDPPAAMRHYRDAIALDPACAEAHRGLATLLADAGAHAEAELHWRQAFPAATIPPRAARPDAIPLLLLVASRGGNIPTRHLIDRHRFAITALYADLCDEHAPLPPHAVLFNAVGDPDFCPDALDAAARIAARSAAPLINPPDRVRATGRRSNAERLGPIPGLIVPRTTRLPRAAIADLTPPVLLRAPGFHTGRHFHRILTRADLARSLASLPGDELLVIEWLDTAGPDGNHRKYRVVAVDGALHPLHLAISPEWKVHYMTAAMATDPSFRAEEAAFLDDMRATLGPLAISALQAVVDALGLDYAGIDFGLAPDGTVLLFEANATMFVGPPGPEPIWDYRRPAVAAVLASVDRLLRARAATAASVPAARTSRL